MVSWPEAVARTGAGGGAAPDVQHARFKFNKRPPIIVMGPSGAGKTRIWSHLTHNSPPDQMSLSIDEGYLVRKNEKAHSIITIPGQYSRTRYFDTDEFFGGETRVTGVIFVTSFGYDRIWENHDVIASTLSPTYDLEALRRRQLRNELDSFSDLCQLIRRKRQLAPEEHQPKWLLIAVNKLDLYWHVSEDARKYYQIGPDGEFGARAEMLTDQLGASLKYHILPVATIPGNYAFHSSRGSLTANSALSSDQCDSSIGCLIETLGELCHE